MRTQDLNGIWHFAFHQGTSLEELNPAAERLDGLMCVPGCFDCFPDEYCQRGCGVYSRDFTLDESWRSCWLRIEGMGLRGAFFLDGRPLGECALPYSTFELECGSLAAGKHSITALLDNNLDAEKMKLFLPFYDFYGFGGFYHGVSLRMSQEENPLDCIFVRTLDYRTGKLELEFVFKHASPAKFQTRLSINDESEAEYEVRDCRLEMLRPDLPLWSSSSPAMHILSARVGSDVVTETFGIREIRAENANILLNGERIYLKGFNRHESAPISGAATTRQQMLVDLQHLKSLNANFIRGCHYPQSQEFLDLCDEMGFLVWEESLGWGNTAQQMQDSNFCKLQVEQTRLMVRNSFNHPSVIIFGFLNENESHTDEGVELCRMLADTIRAENSGRLVTFADDRHQRDRSLQFMDVLTFNAYPGWIQTSEGKLDPMEEIEPGLEKLIQHLRQAHGKDKPIIVSEMGCCGIYGQHDEAAAQWTEEFQAEYVAKVLDAVTYSPEIAGISLWQLNDAKSYHRKGSNIRCKPLSQNLAGAYDQYRRPKLVAQVIKARFGQIEE